MEERDCNPYEDEYPGVPSEISFAEFCRIYVDVRGLDLRVSLISLDAIKRLQREAGQEG